MKIPSDLKPGDRLYYSKTEYATVSWHLYDIWDGGMSVHCETTSGFMRYWIHNGAEVRNDTPPIIRIERIASKPKRAKVDKDAAWLLSMLHEGRHKFADHAAKRIRAIARRLEGGGK